MALDWYNCPDCGQKHLGRIYFGKPPDTLCRDCHNAKDPDEFDSTRCIRCPHCAHRMYDDLWEFGIYEDDDIHPVTCTKCDKDFDVKTTIEISWESPALEVKELDI